ncbi:MAG: hypothetical protein LBU89_03315 [Fibromonadaceae bacterium]|nr:hypothetical protein [Fibromonadaceae bacterium]
MRLLFLSITGQCNRECIHCPMSKWRNNPEYPDSLTLKDCIKAIGFLEPTHCEITGGEPTLVPWLGELCDYLESKGIIYLVKSNGLRRCKNQITAWHDNVSEPPVNYDKVLIIATDDWQEKQDYCLANNMPFKIIGFNNSSLVNFRRNASTFFVCPDGRIKQCHVQESESLLHVGHIGTEHEKTPKWIAKCVSCKAVDDFIIFLEQLQ